MGPIWPSYFQDCTSVIVSVVYCENDTSGHRMEISDVTAVSAISVHNLLTLHTVKMTFTCCTIRSIPHWNTNIPHIRTFQNASVAMTLCFCLQFMVDSANIAQISSSCIQLLCVLSAAPLRSASVLLLFNKRSDWPFLLFCFFKRALCFSSNSNKHRENQEQKYFTRLDIFVHWSVSLKRFERIYLLIKSLLHVYIVYVWA